MKWLIFTLSIFTLTGCEGMKVDDFASNKPSLNLYEYFSGETKAWGIFEDRFGNLRRQFQVDITGTVDGDELILDESFLYADGEKDRRVWRIVKTGKNQYTGSADDVVGSAIGKVAGNALSWQYEMDLTIGDRAWRVQFDDWMFLQPGGVMFNKAVVKKFGIELGTVTLFFMRSAPLREYDGSASQ